MVKKIKKIVVIILLAIFFISSSYIRVYGLSVDDMDIYSKGDQFQLVKKAYIYNVTYHTGWFGKVSKVDIDQPTKNDRTGVIFEKGEIVKYTGKYVHVYGKSGDDAEFYYVEVESGNKKGFINAANVDVYISKIPERPATIAEFISKNGISTITSEGTINSKVKEYKKGQDSNVTNAIKEISGFANDRENMNNFKSREEAKKDLENKYKEIVSTDNTPVILPNDAQFMASAYLLSWEYKIFLKADEIYGKDDGSDNNIDWASLYDKASKNYKNANNDCEMTAAKIVMDQAWLKMKDEEKTDDRQKDYGEIGEKEEDRAITSEKQQDDDDEESTAIYQYPGQGDGTSAGSLDDMIGDADKFIDSTNDTAISAESLQNFSKTFYNIFLTVGIIIAVLVGSILGIKFMIGGAEEKANVKELLIPYIVGCIVVFGAFAIWKIAVTILSGV